MKNKIVIVSIASLLFFCFAFSGCSKSKTGAELPKVDPTKIDQTALKEIANKATNHLTLRQFDEVVAMFDEKAAEAIPADKLSEAWLQTAGNIGKFEELEQSTYSYENDAAKVVDICRFAEKNISITYTFNVKNQISGLWLNFVYKEPTPRETEIFTEEIIRVGKTEPKVYGLLSLPKNVENPPVVIMVQGSGPSDLDETIGAGKNKPFRDIADGLAAKGIATIRYDKRFYAFPEVAMENIKTLTVNDEVLDDANSAVALALADTRLDKGKLFLLGHSFGGMLAPKIATDNPDIAGIISMAGTLRKIEDVIETQAKEVIENGEYTADQKAEAIKAAEAQTALIKGVAKPSEELIVGYPSTYWYSLNQIDQEALAKELAIPMLIMQGTADFQISPEIDFKLWKDALSGKKEVSFKEYDGLNHLMMKSDGKRDMTEYDASKTVEQVVVDDIAAFIGGKNK